MPYTVKGKCVYKKDTGEKVGCTDGDVNDYLAALHANTNESLFEEVDKLIMEQPSDIDPRIIAYLSDLVGLVKNLRTQVDEMQKGPQGLQAMWETFGHFQKRIMQLETGEPQFPPVPDPDKPGWSQAPGTRDDKHTENYFKPKWDSAGNKVFEISKAEE